MLGQIILGWLLADFLSGLGHWFEDEIAEEDWPIIGPLVTVPNRLHHTKPLAFLDSGLMGRNLITWVITAIIGAVLLLFVGPSPWVFSVILGGCLINEVHAWAHKPGDAPRFVRVLQEMGIFQSAKAHAVHHRGENNTGYCILSNFLNPLLDGINFWRGLEAVGRKVGRR